MPMTPEAKGLLSKTIRGSGTNRGLRGRLLDDLEQAMHGEYRLGIPAAKAKLPQALAKRRERLDEWVAEQLRTLGKNKTKAKDAEARFRQEVVKEAAYTLLNRVVYLRLLEASGLRAMNVVTGGKKSQGYQDFRDLANELTHDKTEGYAFLLRLVFDDLAQELPGLFGDVGLTSLVPVPPATLDALIEALDDPGLESCWTDDTCLGWIYQHWNDPEREALDDKIKDGGKVEPHEIASKTQMFTERYIVEWLLQNSLGQLWLAMCERNGWTPRVRANGTLDRLEERRADWRAKRESGDVALDALMPIQGVDEEHWRYWVPQPMPEDAPGYAPESLRDLKLLDPACGSGHFLVIALDLLVALYEEEAGHRGESWSRKQLVEWILERNLHGIDIDPRAIQIAAAALMLKGHTLAADAAPAQLNLVAPNLRLSGLPKEDPALVELQTVIARDTGIPGKLTAELVEALSGAWHLGSLLRVGTAVDGLLDAHEAELAKTVASQGNLFSGHQPAQVKITTEQARNTILDHLEGFLAAHSHADDLGLRLRCEQVAAGIRFARIAREKAYDVVVSNPPYQGVSKMRDPAYVKQAYPRGKADLFAAFLERALELCVEGGQSAMLTMRSWMFIKQYSRLRERFLSDADLRSLGDFDRGAFEDIPDEVVAVVGSIIRRCRGAECPAVALQPTPLDDTTRDSARTARKRAATLCQRARLEFRSSRFAVIRDSPMLYWWREAFLARYQEAPKFGAAMECRFGLRTSNNKRFIRRVWEVPAEDVHLRPVGQPLPNWASVRYAPHVMGAAGRSWCEGVTHVVDWRSRGLQVCVTLERAYGAYPQSTEYYFIPAIAVPKIGSRFSGRTVRYQSVIDVASPSVFPPDRDHAKTLCFLNSPLAREVLASLNPTVNVQPGDVDRLPLLEIEGAEEIHQIVLQSFAQREAARETSIEYVQPGPSSWEATKAWANTAVGREGGAPLPPRPADSEPVTPECRVSHAIGESLGRFSSEGRWVARGKHRDALPNGILFLDGTLAAGEEGDSLGHPASAPVLTAWSRVGDRLGPKIDLRTWLRLRYFDDVHRPMYENRPIHLPLASARKSFVAYVTIHRWGSGTLRGLLADHLRPALGRLEGTVSDLQHSERSEDVSARRKAEKRIVELRALVDELRSYIVAVEECAERGPPKPDSKTVAREVDAPYIPEIYDGVMINAAALWPLLEPLWRDPKKWWKEVANAKGKSDCDWSHLAKRYWPTRVDEKCKTDPSLAVAHGCFWRYHPERAYAWELRLQDEIGPDFTIDEEDSDECRARFLKEQPDLTRAAKEKEAKRRERKAKRAGEAGQRDITYDDDEERDVG